MFSFFVIKNITKKHHWSILPQLLHWSFFFIIFACTIYIIYKLYIFCLRALTLDHLWSVMVFKLASVGWKEEASNRHCKSGQGCQLQSDKWLPCVNIMLEILQNQYPKRCSYSWPKYQPSRDGDVCYGPGAHTLHGHWRDVTHKSMIGISHYLKSVCC